MKNNILKAMKIADKLLRYKFADSKKLVYASVLGNFLLAIILMFPDFIGILQNAHIRWCLASAILLFALLKIYDWTSFSVNTGILVAYLLGVVLEYLQAGLPGESLPPASTDAASKGILFDLLVIISPVIYVFARTLLALGLIGVVSASRKLRR
ncbi:hypothetical protein [Flavilitoribacter nigricans]|uniref:hypothetical protein n=1 Tax=Flavilitoribacter nigricans TaxID=70997 RepID=UPI00117BA447|nr:hypothetical protein [Flavilitoribacter nigricans]